MTPTLDFIQPDGHTKSSETSKILESGFEPVLKTLFHQARTVLVVDKVFESPNQPSSALSSILTVNGRVGARMPKMLVQIEEGCDAIYRLRDEWEELFALSPNARIAASWSWNALWWQHLGGLDRGNGAPIPVIFTLRDSAGHLLGLIPFHFNPHRGVVGLRSLYPLGLRILTPFGVLDHRDLYSLTEEPTYLLPAERIEEAIESVGVVALRFVRERRLDGLMLEVDDFAAMCGLEELEVSTKSRFVPFKKTYEGSQIRALPSDWSELRKSLSKKMKDKISYSPRFIEKSGHVWSTEIHRTGKEFDTALKEVIGLHRLRADHHSGKTHSNYFAHPHSQACLMAIATDLSAKGKAFVSVLRLDDKIVAAQLYLEHNHELIVTYSGFDPAYHQFSPLFVLLCEVIKDAISRKVSILNFLVSGDQYQTRWGTSPMSQRHRFVLVRKNPLSLAKFGAFVWARNRNRKKAEKRES